MSLAHVITTGLGPLYDGAIHLALSPESGVPVVALGLMAGQRGAAAAKPAFGILPLAWVIGGWFIPAPGFPLAAISFLVLGLLIATECHLKSLCVSIIAAVIGALHGAGEGAAMQAEGGGGMAVVGGALVAAIFFLLPAGIVISLKPKPARIAVRVLGSWIAATGLLIAGWWVHERKNSEVGTRRDVGAEESICSGGLISSPRTGAKSPDAPAVRPCLCAFLPSLSWRD